MNDFPAVPLLENRPYDGIHALYLSQEPMLIAAITRGDRGEARHIINHILVHIYSAGEERSDLLKGLLLELVVMMSRAAVQAGAAQSEVLGMNFHLLSDLAQINDDEALAAWLRNTLEHIISTIENQRNSRPPLVFSKVLEFIGKNLHRDISRDDAAHYAAVSPGRLTQVLKEHVGRSFTELLRQCRIQRASDLLRMSERTIAEIADECGFCDQSYFTRVFQEMKGMTPKQFRDAGRL